MPDSKLSPRSSIKKFGCSGKSILMNSQGISEDDAYGMLRRQAMAKRMSMEDLAAAIINANDVLGGAPTARKVDRAKSRLRPKDDDA